MNRQMVTAALLAVVSFLVAVLAAYMLLAGDPAEPPILTYDGSDRDAEPDRSQALDDVAIGVMERAEDAPEQHDLAGDLRGVDATPVAEHEGPLATPSFPGCDTRILPTNWSNRTTTVQAIAPHYTASPNRTGRSDMDGLTAYASRASAGVSWHFLIDAEGYCYYSVPLQKKAWTIGNLNSQTVNIEVIGTGSERDYPAGSRGQAKLRQVIRRVAEIYDIPLRLGAVSNCRVTRRGIITHWMGGSCAGAHHDIRPYSIERLARSMGTPPNRKLEKWERSHRIAHAKLRSRRCRGDCARHYRVRNRKLHQLIERERGR